MKIKVFLASLVLVFIIEIAFAFAFAAQDTGSLQDAVAVNEAVHSVQDDWDAMESHTNQTSLDYVVLDEAGTVRFKTKSGLSESIHSAVIHRDTILDIQVDGFAAGKIIIWNDEAQLAQSRKQAAVFIFAAAMLAQLGVCMGYAVYLNYNIIRPFRKLKGFAERIAEGNLEVPLEMDRQNLFGAFTEGFDIMRSELKKARIAEAEANASKKELVAKLSHDIKTPVASIKAVSEVGAVLAGDEKTRDNYMQIIRKADQINELISNLFTATLEELSQLSVMPEDMESQEVKTLLENADYLHRGTVPPICSCLLYADKLRLQQVLDNIFVNSYKYANTEIEIEVWREDTCLAVSIEDYGGGVSWEELPLLKEKFKRGKNTAYVEGAGLGLFISDYFMEKMQGRLVVENGKNGLKVTVMVPLSGVLP